MGNLISWPTPAKINLFLRVNGRRADGYHELQTLFAILDFGDEITFNLRDDDVITINPDFGFPVEKNIIYKAIKLLSEKTGKTIGVDVNVIKKIPQGGGLGGGSSDAATTLVALNWMLKLGFSVEELAEFGRTLGADVPVFVKGRSALAEGVGEILTPLEIPEKYYLVVAPINTPVSTKDVFTHPLLPRNTPKIPKDQILSTPMINDCEELVKNNYPNVARTLSWLLKYATSRMTGTGSCCFGEFDDKKAAVKVYESIPDDMRGFVAKACNYSPLHTLLQRLNSSNQTTSKINQ